MITSNILSSVPGVKHGFFTRQGGSSSGIYESLNCGPGSSDDLENVINNRAVVAQEMGVEADALLSLYQTHSPDVVTVTEKWSVENPPKADGMVTNVPGIALGVLTADCAPILFSNDAGTIIGAAHSGWKGAVGGVIEATIAAMVALGAESTDIRCVVGPCIRMDSYEVGPEMRDQIIALDPGDAGCFKPSTREGHFQFDLAGYALTRLYHSKVGMLEDTPGDTYSDEDTFFSYRRATHRDEPDYGRQISAITITS